MRMTMTLLGAAMVIGGPVLAQTAPAANRDAPANPVISTTRDANKPGAPAAGANSFTEGQAKSRLESAGYSNVSELVKDRDGLWRGRASKGGHTVEVAVDYQGNIVPR